MSSGAMKSRLAIFPQDFSYTIDKSKGMTAMEWLWQSTRKRRRKRSGDRWDKCSSAERMR